MQVMEGEFRSGCAVMCTRVLWLYVLGEKLLASEDHDHEACRIAQGGDGVLPVRWRQTSRNCRLAQEREADRDTAMPDHQSDAMDRFNSRSPSSLTIS